jgi:hypothetical protein
MKPPTGGAARSRPAGVGEALRAAGPLASRNAAGAQQLVQGLCTDRAPKQNRVHAQPSRPYPTNAAPQTQPPLIRRRLIEYYEQKQGKPMRTGNAYATGATITSQQRYIWRLEKDKAQASDRHHTIHNLRTATQFGDLFFVLPIARATHSVAITSAAPSARRSSAGSRPSRRRWAAPRRRGWCRGAACAPPQWQCPQGLRVS